MITSDPSKLRNLSLHRTITRSGDQTWMIIHDNGWRDPYFDYFAKDLLENKLCKFNTREQYCRFVAAFIDYIMEAAKWYREAKNKPSLASNYRSISCLDLTTDLSGPALVELIRIYPKVLAGGAHSADPVVTELSKRLNRKVVSHLSQQVHIAAINRYLALSEAFNIRLQQSGLQEINGLPLLSEANLFPDIGREVELSRFERMALTTHSMLAGVLAGGPKLKRLAGLKPVVVDTDAEDHYDYDSAFPVEYAPELINLGFKSYRDRSLYCLLMASGVRISEALCLTWNDIDCKNRRIYIRNPRKKDLEKVYLGFLTLEQRNNLPWKGRTHPVTLLIEPFASEFWRLLGLYTRKEMLLTSAHPFVFQVLKAENASAPLILSDCSNLRKNFKGACSKVGVDTSYSPHSLRHMFGVYCLNFWPNADGSYGLAPEIVQFLMGHSDRKSTMNYAKPDTLILEAAQRVNTAVLSGFSVEDRCNIRPKILEQMLRAAEAEVRDINSLQN